MKRYLKGLGAIFVLLLMTVNVDADAYVALPADPTQAIYFPTVATVICYMETGKIKKAKKKIPKKDKRTFGSIETDRCRPLLSTIMVEGSLLMLSRPLHARKRPFA